MGFSGEQVMSIVSLLVLLVFWIMILRNKRAEDRWLNETLLRRQREIEAKQKPAQPKAEEKSDREPTGPWG